MTAAYSWFLAVRYLLSRWVNALGIAGIAVAVWALIVVISVFSGFIAEIRDHIRGASADLVLTAVRADCSYEAVRPILERDPDVVATAPRLQHYAMLFPRAPAAGRQIQFASPRGSSPADLDFVNLIGVDPARESVTTAFDCWLQLGDDPPGAELFEVSDRAHPFDVPAPILKTARQRAGLDRGGGAFLQSGRGQAVLLGLKRLTRSQLRWMHWELIDLVTARLVPDPEGGEQAQRILRSCVATGAFQTRYRTFDDNNAFVDIELLREMLGHDEFTPGSIDLVTEVAIRTRPGADLDAVAARLTAAAAAASGGRVETWEQQNQLFLSAVDHERAMMKVVLFCVMVVAAFLVYATLHMMVTTKVKDIGILTSLGALPRGIAAVFLLTGCIVAALGCGAGAVLGALSAHYLNDVNDWFKANFQLALFPTDLYDLDRIPYRLEAGWIAQVLVATFALALLVAYLPARRAARLDPVKALSYE